MGTYTFCEGQLSLDLQPAFERFLFNEERHLVSQSQSGWSTFSLVDYSAKKIIAQVHFHIEGRIASSPLQASFGSVEFSEIVSAETLFEFISAVDFKLKEKGVRKIIIKDAPQIYRPQQSAILAAILADLDFRISKSEINSALVIDDSVLGNKIDDAERRRLKRCEEEHLMFQLLGRSELRKIYEFINHCRKERGTTLSMTFEALERTVKKCPNDFLLFGVFAEAELIAAVVSVRVTKSIIYNFYPAHRKSADRLSPMVFLLDNLYRFCVQNEVKILDLGTSFLNGGTNFSLLNFKTNVGGIPSLKLTFEKEI